MKRRDLLLIGGLGALAAGWQVFGVRPPKVEWRAITGLPGWRFGTSGEVSGGGASPLSAAMPGDSAPLPLPADRLAGAVFRDSGARVAVFTDHFCPYCRVLFGRLIQTDLQIAWHELPLLRPESHIAARAAEAARLQGGYVRFQEAMIAEGFRPSPSYLAGLAEAAGLDGARLRRDMAGEAVRDGLLVSARAAQSLGIFATPGVVAGRSVLLGAATPERIAEMLNWTG